MGKILRGSETGWAFPDPGEVDAAYCGVCRAKMNARRNVVSATSFAEAMARSKHAHDEFKCPNVKERWHRQAILLRRAIRDTPSASIAKILTKELNSVVRRKKSTKDLPAHM